MGKKKGKPIIYPGRSDPFPKSVSLAEQRKALQKFAKEHGLVVTGTYVDREDRRGEEKWIRTGENQRKKFGKSIYQQVLQDIKGGDIREVIVADRERWSRSQTPLPEWVHIIQKK